jgi:hypothetical protein
VDLRDVRVVQRGQQLGFALKASHPVGVGGEFITHPACANCSEDLVDAEAGPWGQSHEPMGDRA